MSLDLNSRLTSLAVSTLDPVTRAELLSIVSELNQDKMLRSFRARLHVLNAPLRALAGRRRRKRG